MSPKCVLAAAALLACTSSFAVTFSGGTVAAADPLGEQLSGLHDANGSAFIDTFDFLMTGAGVASAVVFDFAFELNGNVAAAPFAFSALVLADSSNNALPGGQSIDIDGSDGWQVAANLPGPGTYRVLLQGAAPTSTVDPTPTQFYIGGLATVVNVVPEPATYGLMAMGLLALAGLRRRQ